MKIFYAADNSVRDVEPVEKTEQQWRELLTPEQFDITRRAATEAPFSQTCAVPLGKHGVYQCVCCGTDLFEYEHKFESGTGWPSFIEPISDLNVKYVDDSTLGMERTEVRCARCGAHLGHVFDDGPAPTGKRYCINTLAIKLAE